MDDIRLIEFSVRPVTRYIVTRYEERSGDGNHTTSSDPRIAENRVGRAKVCCGSSGHGEFDNAQTAYDVAYALCRAEHERIGYRVDDDRIRYPEHPEHMNAQPE
jgi:hypothetical protein